MNWKLKKFNDLSCGELYNILKLRTEVFIVEQQCPYQDIDGKDENSFHLYSEDNGEIVAYLRILPKGVSYDETAIGRVIIRKKHRGKGLARDMMLTAIKFIEENLKETKIRLQAQAYLIDFYESFGFKGISKEYLEDNIPHIDMIYRK